MESFINRWLWLMSLQELRRLRDSIGEQNKKVVVAATAVVQPQPSPSHQSSSGSGKGPTVSSTTTSPPSSSSSEVPPPPSPASSVGSTSSTSGQQQQQQNDQIAIMHKLIASYERYVKFSEYNVRSQSIWDANEHQISDNKLLSGVFLLFLFAVTRTVPLNFVDFFSSSSSAVAEQTSVRRLSVKYSASFTLTARRRCSPPTS